MEEEAAFSILNMRYYALSALSMRRHIMTNLYLTMKTKYMAEPENGVYLEFLETYSGLLSRYEEGIVPYLVEADF